MDEGALARVYNRRFDLSYKRAKGEILTEAELNELDLIDSVLDGGCSEQPGLSRVTLDMIDWILEVHKDLDHIEKSAKDRQDRLDEIRKRAGR